MKDLVMFPLRLVWQAIVLPTKLLIASLGFTFRAGVSVGKLPVKGGAVVSRALGWKLIGALAVGVVIGVVVGRQVERMMHDRDHEHDHDAHDSIPLTGELVFDAGVTA
jgi:hypothetical protein